VKVAYPIAKEELIDFLNRFRLKNSEVMLCGSVFDKEATKSLEGFILKSKKRGKWSADHRPKFSFTKSYIPFINNSSTTNYVNKNGQGKTSVPHAKAPVQKCQLGGMLKIIVMSEQDAWNEITTYLAENKIKKALEAELQKNLVIRTIEKDVVEAVGEEPKELMVKGQKLDCIFAD
jgi:hypothetical protein